jgi:hypothetical protein
MGRFGFMIGAVAWGILQGSPRVNVVQPLLEVVKVPGGVVASR